jgi:pimeloyl-ACP methyl ester carboxylesterase
MRSIRCRRPKAATLLGLVIERTVAGDGLRISVRDWPGSRAAALLVHGLASSSRIWDLVAPRLARAGIRAVAYDQRGHGRTGKPPSGYGFERTTADAVAVIRALRLGRPLVVGHSWGANVALELAVRRPRSVRGLVLVDGGFLSLRDRFDWATAKRVLAPPEIRGTPVEEFLRRAVDRLGSELDVTPEIQAVLLSLMRVDAEGRIHPRLSRPNHLRILRALWLQDTIGLLRRVRMPTLAIGVRSRPGSPDSAGLLLEKRRAAEVVRAIGDPVRFEWIDGIHDLPLQRPEVLARRIVRAMPS